jgi:lysozyme
MNEDRKLTAAGAALIQHFEGCLEKSGDRYRAYTCPAGVTTIGFGSTHHGGHHIDSTTRWTLQECHDAFIKDMAAHERNVRKLVTVPLSPWQFDALVSFDYNTGALGKSTLLKKVNAGDFEGAALEFHKWVKGGGKTLPGLVRRRASESLLFQNIPDENYDGKPDKVIKPPPHPMAQAVDAPGDEA